MQCPEHKHYKGIRKTKRDCPHCQAVYEEVNKRARFYTSLTTPSFRCGFSHIYAEALTLMIFGRQPEFFWRTNSDGDPKIRKFFQGALKFINNIREKHPQWVKDSSRLLYTIYHAERRRIEAERLHLEAIAKEKKRKDEWSPDMEQVQKTCKELGPVEHQARWSKWQHLMGAKDGSEKEGRGNNPECS